MNVALPLRRVLLWGLLLAAALPAQDPGPTEVAPPAVQGPETGAPDLSEPEGLDELDELDALDAELEGLDELDAIQGIEGGAGGLVAGLDDEDAFLSVTGVKGFAETRVRSFFRDRNRGREDEQWQQELQLEFDFALPGGVTAYFRPRFLLDVLDDELVRTQPLELYATLEREGFDLRAGLLVENWGIADTFNPVDVLNRRDLALDPLDQVRLGELGFRARLLLDGGETLAEPTLSFYAVPFWQRARFPTRRSRWSFAVPPDEIAEEFGASPDGFDNSLFALRAQAVLNTDLANADVQLIVARGPERFPIFAITQPAGAGLNLIPIYYGVWTVGGGLRAVPNFDLLADYTLKAEVVHKASYRAAAREPTELPDDFLQYALGFDRVVPQLLTDRDQLTLTVEYVGETGADDSTSGFRPFDNDLVLRGFWEANDFARSSVELRSVLDLDSAEWIVEGIFERQLRAVHEDLQLRLGVQVFDPARSEVGFFALFPTNSNVELALRFDF